MTTQTLEQQIAALNATLVAATKACPEVPCGLLECACDGSGCVARFPGFRQACPCSSAGGTDGINHWYDLGGCRNCYIRGRGAGLAECTINCTGCNGLGWQVRAGGLKDALAGLTRIQAKMVFDALGEWAYWTRPGLPDDPMPSSDAILVKGLELVVEVAGLEGAVMEANITCKQAQDALEQGLE